MYTCVHGGSPSLDLSFVQTTGTSKFITFEALDHEFLTTERLTLGHSEMEATGPANDRQGGANVSINNIFDF